MYFISVYLEVILDGEDMQDMVKHPLHWAEKHTQGHLNCVVTGFHTFLSYHFHSRAQIFPRKQNRMWVA